MSNIIKILTGSVVFLIFIVWVGAGIGVIEIIFQLLTTSLLAWREKEGILKWYLALGSSFVFIFIIWVFIKIFKPLTKLLFNGLEGIFEFVIIMVFLGLAIILFIPLITIGWPIFIWMMWSK